MSSYEKVVKLACKPKAAPPKAKYLEPIIAATWSDDGAVHDVCKALSPRLREPNSVVVFKALIVLHMMMRNGSTDNVLSYLSSSDVLRLKNVTDAPWEGYTAPENLKSYAMYMDTRIKAYANLKHDAIRVQSESNRDHRASGEDSFGAGRNARGGGRGGVSRSKTIAGRKLRQMSVEKGLLRETKIVQRMVTALLSCKFYLDNLEDELVVSALQLLVRDLLVLFQAVNEGVINVLEHYFEMSHVDATTALEIYRHFCAQTKEVVEYLSVAKKLQNILGIPIPNLKHAPVSLAGALQEYLNDPNFEQNRVEYRTNKAIADGRPVPKELKTGTSKNDTQSPSTLKAAPGPPVEGNQSKAESSTASQVTDFFASIEQEQSTMFNPQTNSPSISYFQQQATSNPFSQGQTSVNQFGQQMPSGPFGGLHPQPTGAPFGGPFLHPQPTGFLQPQATGFNPFRQSVLMPQMTGFPSIPGTSTGAAGNPMQSNSPFPNTQPPFPIPPFASVAQSASNPTFLYNPDAQTNASMAPSIQRPQSTPILSQSDESLKPVVSHQTGSRNPFGIPRAASPPPMPKMPTLQELANSAFNKPGGITPFTAQNNSTFPSSTTQSPVGTPGSGMGGIASMFTGVHRNGTSSPPPSTNRPSSPFSNHVQSFSTPPASSLNIIQPQTTGFAGITPFKPASSFGASLLDSLPSIPGPSSGSTDAPTTARPMSPTRQLSSPPAANTGISTPFGSINAKSTLSPISESEPATNFLQPSLTATSTLRPLASQLTGTPNPFRASMLDPSNSFTSLQSQPTGFGSSPFGNSTVAPFQSQSSFGQQAFAVASSGNAGQLAGNSNQPTGQQQQQSSNALISFS